jgi:Putative Actinobacterial Holin-X, holin superfamily III
MEPGATEPPKDDRSLAALFTDVRRDLSALVRQEIALARAEALEKVDQARTGAIALGAGGVVALVGLYFLFQALAFGVAALLARWLGDEIAVWLAPLLVGLLAAVIGGAVLAKGLRNLRNTDLAPRQTAHSLRRDAELVREHVR